MAKRHRWGGRLFGGLGEQFAAALAWAIALVWPMLKIMVSTEGRHPWRGREHRRVGYALIDAQPWNVQRKAHVKAVFKRLSARMDWQRRPTTAPGSRAGTHGLAGLSFC